MTTFSKSLLRFQTIEVKQEQERNPPKENYLLHSSTGAEQSRALFPLSLSVELETSQVCILLQFFSSSNATSADSFSFIKLSEHYQFDSCN